VAGATSTIEPPPSNSKYAMPSSMKKMAPIKENKQNTVVAKMREKVAAEKNSERADPALPTRPSQTVESIRSMSSSSTIATTLVPQIPTASSQYASKPHPSALTSIIDPANKPTASPKKIVPEKQSSPIQTYVMSDREESDSEDESDEEEDDRHKPKKSVSKCIVIKDASMRYYILHLCVPFLITLSRLFFRFHCGRKRPTFIAHWNDNLPTVPIDLIQIKYLEKS
jgi:hypothetical protein